MLVDNEDSTRMKSSPAQIQLPNGGLTSSPVVQTMGVTRRVGPTHLDVHAIVIIVSIY